MKDVISVAPPGSHKAVFLTARWKHLINLTYAVDPELLRPHLPPGLELDIWEGSAHVSLVAFDFLSTRLLGIPVPGYTNFPEVNLRFYVRWRELPAVVFIREYVPKRAIAWSAKLLYNEPYRRIPMTSSVNMDGEVINVRHNLGGGELQARARLDGYFPRKGTAEYHFKEHDLGFGVDHRQRTLCYRVEHPEWKVFPIESVDMSLNFETLYGSDWAFLQNTQPRYRLLAEGSDILVRFPFAIERDS
ncbi:MAG: DUF2071 domain-containing protein [Leptospiraceae bacterium]|nr:DUF2071 domain-containing protein [Leptospiraceae bacterium]